jgi:hypothetical protein
MRKPDNSERKPDVDPFVLALEQTLESMPYNSATEYHTSFGEESPDSRLGAACVYQTLDAARRAEEMGAPHPVFLRDERHVAAVFDAEGDIIVLDPYLLHRDPIRFPRDEIRKGLSTVEVAAAPVRADSDGVPHEAKVLARYKTTRYGYVIRLSYSKYSPAKHLYSLSRHFSLRSDSIFNPAYFTDDMYGMLTHPEQTSVSVRAVLPGLTTTAEAIIPLHGFAERAFASSDIWLRTNDGLIFPNGHALSDQVWGELEVSLGINRDLIGQHLVEAAHIYKRVADSGRPVAPYSLVSE